MIFFAFILFITHTECSHDTDEDEHTEPISRIGPVNRFEERYNSRRDHIEQLRVALANIYPDDERYKNEHEYMLARIYPDSERYDDECGSPASIYSDGRPH